MRELDKMHKGKVVANEDPKKMGRLRIAIENFFDKLPIEDIPWAWPRTPNGKSTYNNVAIGEYVAVSFNNGHLYAPIWEHITPKEAIISIDDYKAGCVLLDKQYEEFDGQGFARIYSSNGSGISYIYNNGKIQSTIHQRTDGTISIESNGTMVHIKDGTISLGSENESDEPCVLGNKNVEALKALDASRSNIVAQLKSGFETLSAKCLTSPYTGHLAADFIQLATLIDTLDKKEAASNKTAIEKTPSQKTTLN